MSDEIYPDVGTVDYDPLLDSMDRYADSAVNVLEGVSRGFLAMVIPLVSIGIAVALSRVLIKMPIKVISGEI